MISNLIFWQNFPNHLQSSFVRALSKNISVTLVCQEDLPKWRRSIGWEEPDYGSATVIIQPEARQIRYLLEADNRNIVHIFSGLRGYPMVWRAFQQILPTEAMIGIYSEPSNWTGVNGFLRLMRGRFDRKRYGERIDFIMAIGHLGTQWFQKCGYDSGKIYPFGYFVESPATDISALGSNINHDSYQIVFIGQCVQRKGVDILLRSLGELQNLAWELTIIGDGDKQDELQQLSQRLYLGYRVGFKGALSNMEAMQYLERADLLVLPSRWDGWGAVVNEALMRGVPVICSTNCGAADLLQNSMRGSVFLVGSVEQLRDKLQYQISLGKLAGVHKNRIKMWASNNITGEIAADYLLEIIRHSQDAANSQRPVAPWLSEGR